METNKNYDHTGFLNDRTIECIEALFEEVERYPDQVVINHKSSRTSGKTILMLGDAKIKDTFYRVRIIFNKDGILSFKVEDLEGLIDL